MLSEEQRGREAPKKVLFAFAEVNQKVSTLSQRDARLLTMQGWTYIKAEDTGKAKVQGVECMRVKKQIPVLHKSLINEIIKLCQNQHLDDKI